MTALQTQITADEAIFFSDFAVACTYHRAAGGADVSTLCIVDEAQDLGFVAAGQAAIVQVEIPRSAISEPVIYDEITVGSTVYRVESVTSGDEAGWLMFCTVGRRIA